jgi:hypothetical protein
MVHADPAIHISADPRRPEEAPVAEAHRLAQFQAWELLRGSLWPQLGGDDRSLDVLGINYYPHNQWLLDGPTVRREEPLYRPFRDILGEIWERFGRPMLITETGAQGEARAPWLRYVCEEVRAARQAGLPIYGICLYPIVDYPGWDDDRHCPSGLWGFPDGTGARELYLPLAQELERQAELFRQSCEEQSREESGAGFNTITPAGPPRAARSPREEEREHVVC